MIKALRNHKQGGFTLIELMIVVAIIGILSAIAIPNFLAYRTSGQDAAAKSEARNFYTAALAQVADTGVGLVFAEGALPTGFTKNPDISYLGTLAVSNNGVVTSMMMGFQYGSSGTLFSLNSDGSITG